MATVYIVQHGQKEPGPGDPALAEAGRAQAARTAARLSGCAVDAVYASDLRRARETAAIIAAPLGLPVEVDARARERMNWDGAGTVDEFMAEWARASADRDYAPTSGDSSRVAGERFRAAIIDAAAAHDAVIVATHGGVTYDLLRTLLGDDTAPEVANGVPSCAITTLEVDGDRVTVRGIADTQHL